MRILGKNEKFDYADVTIHHSPTDSKVVKDVVKIKKHRKDIIIYTENSFVILPNCRASLDIQFNTSKKMSFSTKLAMFFK